MNRLLVVRRRAALDAEEAFHWHEQRTPGLGARFRLELLALFDRIVERPHLFRLVQEDIRQAALDSFQYKVFFEIKKDRVIVFAILHKRRHPDLWRHRQ